MTVIAWKDGVLAADRQNTNVGMRSETTKIVKRTVRGMVTLLAGAGDRDDADALLEWYVAGAVPAEFPAEARKGDCLVLVIDRQGARTYGTGPYPRWHEDVFYAMGSGRDYAMAAMHLGESAARAVEVASVFDVNCGMGVDALTLD